MWRPLWFLGACWLIWSPVLKCQHLVGSGTSLLSALQFSNFGSSRFSTLISSCSLCLFKLMLCVCVCTLVHVGLCVSNSLISFDRNVKTKQRYVFNTSWSLKHFILFLLQYVFIAPLLLLPSYSSSYSYDLVEATGLYSPLTLFSSLFKSVALYNVHLHNSWICHQFRYNLLWWSISLLCFRFPFPSSCPH